MEVVSAGIADVTPSDGAPLAMLHVRIVLSNSAALAWRFDVRSARIDLGLDGVVRAVLANGDVPTLPVVRVEPGTRVMLDLFAQLPARVTEVETLSVRARVATPDRRMTIVASYAAAARPPVLAGAGPPAGTAATWWARPTFAWGTFHRGDGPITPRAPAVVSVVLRTR